MAFQQFKFVSIPASQIIPRQPFDKQNDGKFAILPIRVYTDIIPDRILVVGVDFQIHVFTPDEPVYVLQVRNKRSKGE